jgi:hypothetical protein
MNKTAGRLLAAVSLASGFGLPAAHAQVQTPEQAQVLARAAQPAGRQGLYLAAGVGSNHYGYDCVFSLVCRDASSTSNRIGLGWRSGRWGIEGALHDFGRAEIDPPGQALRLRAAVLNAAWFVDFTPRLEGALRVGVSSVKSTRSGSGAAVGSLSDTSAFFGLGLAWWATPQVALEFTFDVTGGEDIAPSGSSVRGSSATARTNSLGVRIQF